MTRSQKSVFEPAEELVQQGNLAEAAEAYPPLLAAHPGHSAAHHNFAILLREVGRIKEAIHQSKVAYELSPDNPIIIFSFGLSQELGGFLAEAEWYYRNALSLRPEYTAALNNLGRLLDQMERPSEALPFLQRAHHQAPNDADISLNLANAYISVGKPEEAENLIMDNESTSALNSLGITKYVRRDWAGAENFFRHAIRSDPEFAGAHENLALTLLHLGDFETGWKEYEWRWQNTSNNLTMQFSDKPLWDGANLAGKSLLIYGEQGFGDTIQFIRYVNLIKKNGGSIFLACQSELTELLRDAPGIDEAFAVADVSPAFDCQAPLLSLPRIMGLSSETTPTFNPYLKVTDKMELPGPLKDGFKIGICWAGRSRHVHDPHRNRSCPANFFNVLAKLPSVELFSLQVEPPRENQIVPFRLTELTQQISNFLDTAKAISALDLIVSVDTAVIHLTGALGKPGIVALNYAADWRWGDGNGTTPWYSSIQMIRQAVPGDWKGVFQRISAHVKTAYLNSEPVLAYKLGKNK